MDENTIDAILLAEESKWTELMELIIRKPASARQVDDYGMLPLHWSCTEASVPSGLVHILLKACPQAASTPNKGNLLPLHIALKAQAKIGWIQALMTCYPESVIIQTPSGETAADLARNFNLPSDVYDAIRAMESYVQKMSQFSESKNLEPVEEDATLQGRSTGGFFRPSSQRSTTSSSASSGRMSAPQTWNRLSHLSDHSNRFSDPSNKNSKPLPCQTSTRLSTRTVVSLPPRWTNAPSCHLCQAKFGAFKKRHHCRNCGQAICKLHSSKHQLSLPHFGLAQRQRICTACYDSLANADSNQLLPSDQSVVPVALAQRQSDEASNRFSMQPPLLNQRQISEPVKRSSGGGQSFSFSMPRQPPAAPVDIDAKLQAIALTAPMSTVDAKLEAPIAPVIDQKQELLPVVNSLPPDPPIETTVATVAHEAHEDSFEIDELMMSPVSYEEEKRDGSEYNAFARYVEGAPSPLDHLNEPILSDDHRMVREQDREDRITEEDMESMTTSWTERPSSLLTMDTSFQTDESRNSVDLDSETKSDEVDTLVSLGVAMMGKGSISGAIAAFQRAVEIFPQDATLYIHLGKALHQDGDLDAAVDAVSTAFDLEPTATTSTLLGKILYEKGDHDAAIKAYERSLAIQHQ